MKKKMKKEDASVGKWYWVRPYQVEEKIRNEILPWLENMSPEEKSKWERFYLEMSGGKITLEDVKDDLIRYVKEAKEYNKKEEEE